MYTGHSKLVLRHLGFLQDEYNFNYCFQSFDSYNGFWGPIDTYSFYNQNGCITLQHIVQRGEVGLFFSKQFSKRQQNLLERKIDLASYISCPCWRFSTLLRRLSNSIKMQLSSTSSMFGIHFDIG